MPSMGRESNGHMDTVFNGGVVVENISEGKVFMSKVKKAKAANRHLRSRRKSDFGHSQAVSLEPTNMQPIELPNRDLLNERGLDSLKKLKALVSLRNGNLEDGWEVVVSEKKGGNLEKFYISPQKKKFRSMLEVLRFLGLSERTDKVEDKGEVKEACNGTANMETDEIEGIGILQPFGKESCGGKANEQSSTTQKESTVSPPKQRGVDLEIRSAREMKEKVDAGWIVEKDDPPLELVHQRCQVMLREIVAVDQFAELCSMFQGSGSSGIWEKGFMLKPPAVVAGALDFHLVGMRMATGVYGAKPELFLSDIQQVWNRIHVLGKELTGLSNSLADLSENLYKNEVLSLFSSERSDKFPVASNNDEDELREKARGSTDVREQSSLKKVLVVNGIRRCETRKAAARRDVQVEHIGGEEELDETSRQAVVEALVITGTESVCKACGVVGGGMVICDACEVAYHMGCATISGGAGLERVPEGSWCCPGCVAAGKEAITDSRLLFESEEGISTAEEDGAANGDEPHCIVCERIANTDFVSTVEKPPPLPLPLPADTVIEKTATCQACGVGGSDQGFLASCDACPRSYHAACLKSPPPPPLPGAPWYCPSCLCRTCLVDVDDDKILLCDRCDEGFHIYCLSPPLRRIPNGSWFCPPCLGLSKVASKRMPSVDAKRGRRLNRTKRAVHALSTKDGTASKRRKVMQYKRVV